MDELLDFLGSTGLSAIGPGEGLMILVGLVFLYLAVARDMEPYELLPIGLGVIVANLPLTGLLVRRLRARDSRSPASSASSSTTAPLVLEHTAAYHLSRPRRSDRLRTGDLQPQDLLLGAAAQVGIFVAFWGALATGVFELRKPPRSASLAERTAPRRSSSPRDWPGAARNHCGHCLLLHGGGRVHSAPG